LVERKAISPLASSKDDRRRKTTKKKEEIRKWVGVGDDFRNWLVDAA